MKRQHLKSLNQAPNWVRILFPLAVFCIPLFLLTSSIRLLTTEFYLGYQYRKLGIIEKTGLSQAELDDLTHKLLKFLISWEKFPPIDIKRGGIRKPFFASREISHLYDVQRVFKVVFAVQKITGLYLLFCLGLALFPPWRRNFGLFAFYIFIGCLISLFLISLLVLSIFFQFESFFDKFHQAFFPAGSWLFGPQDILIQLYPEQFWSNAARTTIFLTLSSTIMLGTLSGLISYRLLKKV